MKEFQQPEFDPVVEEESKNYGRFVLEPLERGFGITLGNALRRVLLSSIPGAAVNGVTIKGARQEYSVLPGVLEDPTMIILNLKGLVVSILSAEDTAAYTLTLDVTNTGETEREVTAADIVCPGEVTIINTDLVIAHVAPGGNLQMAITVANGRGYASAEENKRNYDFLSATSSGDSFPIPVDSSFSPIVKVNYSVTPARVQRQTDFDKLVLEVWTNGAIDPKRAVAMAAEVLVQYFNLFVNMDDHISELSGDRNIFTSKTASQRSEAADKPIEALELSVRSYNCLKRAGISTIGDLTDKTEEEMMKVRNLGKKSLKEVKAKLVSLNLNFRNEKN